MATGTCYVVARRFKHGRRLRGAQSHRDQAQKRPRIIGAASSCVGVMRGDIAPAKFAHAPLARADDLSRYCA
jgi:hypothetical protein